MESNCSVLTNIRTQLDVHELGKDHCTTSKLLRLVFAVDVNVVVDLLYAILLRFFVLFFCSEFAPTK